MYLYKREYFSSYDFKNTEERENHEAVKFRVTVETVFPNGYIKTQRTEADKPDVGLELYMPVCYWRKANAIHKWFCDLDRGRDECQDIFVDGSKLKELVELCQYVLKHKKEAKEKLPTQDGFFFGSTEYDKYYFDDLEYTVNKLKDCDFNADYIYRASW